MNTLRVECLGQLGGGPGALLRQQLGESLLDALVTLDIGSGPPVLAVQCRESFSRELMEQPANGGQAAVEMGSELRHRPARGGEQDHFDPVALGGMQGGIATPGLDRGTILGRQGNS